MNLGIRKIEDKNSKLELQEANHKVLHEKLEKLVKDLTLDPVIMYLCHLFSQNKFAFNHQKVIALLSAPELPSNPSKLKAVMQVLQYILSAENCFSQCKV